MSAFTRKNTASALFDSLSLVFDLSHRLLCESPPLARDREAIHTAPHVVTNEHGERDVLVGDEIPPGVIKARAAQVREKTFELHECEQKCGDEIERALSLSASCDLDLAGLVTTPTTFRAELISVLQDMRVLRLQVLGSDPSAEGCQKFREAVYDRLRGQVQHLGNALDLDGAQTGLRRVARISRFCAVLAKVEAMEIGDSVEHEVVRDEAEAAARELRAVLGDLEPGVLRTVLHRAKKATYDQRGTPDGWEYVPTGTTAADVCEVIRARLTDSGPLFFELDTRPDNRSWSTLSNEIDGCLPPIGSRRREAIEASLDKASGQPQTPTIKPRDDKDTRTLSYGGQKVKVFRQPAKHQETVLRAFEEEGWPIRIDDPLPAGKAPDTVRRLNRCMKRNLIQFSQDGRESENRGIIWCRAESSEENSLS